MAELHYVAIKIIIRRACTLTVRNLRTFVVMRLASEKQYARPHGKGLTFIKRETKTRLWAFALHDLNE